jgi:hypothetical protein
LYPIVILDSLRRLSVDDVEDDGSGMSDSGSSLFSPPVPVPSIHQECRGLTMFAPEEWENSAVSSDQMDSLGEDDIRDVDA